MFIKQSLLFVEVELMETRTVVGFTCIFSDHQVASIRRSGINGNDTCNHFVLSICSVASIRRSGINGNTRKVGIELRELVGRVASIRRSGINGNLSILNIYRDFLEQSRFYS